eukprot:TRINITY_DN1795_c0_g1_i1.p1 TRINITY_DN1795_c0_g1~~TRINITY_DN1795_c0_g1_i1.p1  ORF type:complete len:1270 (-),score=349.20 TRINITY_DN1795_c0_g1_i1:50-3772(-)
MTFDNFFVDLSSVLHMCAHGNRDGPIKSDAETFAAVFNLVDRLFDIVQPRKLLYLAIDGVPPRAKLSEQRQRSFRGARQAKGERFDPCNIAPGTAWMENCSRHIQYYVKQKLVSDARWRAVTVVVSGADVAGEGEQKIAEHLRNLPGAETSTHCIYGLDADLIMLGLASHRHHVSILRERVVPLFAKQILELSTPHDFTFLHISLLRQYLFLEMTSISQPKIKFSFENVVEDLITLIFLVGNDFLPHFPFFEPDYSSLDEMFALYKNNFLPQTTGYIVENGKINFSRLGELVRLILPLEEQKVKLWKEAATAPAGRGEEEEEDGAQARAFGDDGIDSTDQTPTTGTASAVAGLPAPGTAAGSEAAAGAAAALKTMKISGPSAAAGTAAAGAGAGAGAGDAGAEAGDFAARRLQYYNSLFGNENAAKKASAAWLEGLCWSQQYYSGGVPSWEWYYPFHHAPMMCDLLEAIVEQAKPGAQAISFSVGAPLPVHLALVCMVPPSSAGVLPKVYQPLLDATSTVRDLFPVEYPIHHDERGREWKDVALLPFIDMPRLRKAFQALDQGKLTPEEAKRGESGPAIQYTATAATSEGADVVTVVAPPSESTQLPEVSSRTVKIEAKALAAWERKATVVPETLPPIVAGYPNLMSLNVRGVLRRAEMSRITGLPTRALSMVLQIPPAAAPANPMPMLSSLLGKTIRVGWPFLKDAQVEAVFLNKILYRLHHETKNIDQVQTFFSSDGAWVDFLRDLKNKVLGQSGIDLGEISVVVRAREVLGKVRRSGQQGGGGGPRAVAQYRPHLAATTFDYPLQLCVPGASQPAASAVALPNDVAVGQQALVLENIDGVRGEKGIGNLFGTVVTITGVGSSGTHVDVSFAAPLTAGTPGSNALFGLRAAAEGESDSYLAAHAAAKQVGVSGLTFARVCASLVLHPSNTDLGLNLKSDRRNLIMQGYTRRAPVPAQPAGHHGRVKPTFDYSLQAVEVVKAYRDKFPAFFTALEKFNDVAKIQTADIFEGMDPAAAEKQIVEMAAFLQTLPCASLPLIYGDIKCMSAAGVEKVEQAAIAYVAANEKRRTVTVKNVPAGALLFPEHDPTVVAFSFPSTSMLSTPLAVGSRVVYVRGSSSVPFGSLGTVVTLSPSVAEVVFDTPLVGGTTLRNRLKTLRGATVPVASLVNLSVLPPPGTTTSIPGAGAAGAAAAPAVAAAGPAGGAGAPAGKGKGGKGAQASKAPVKSINVFQALQDDDS